MERKLYLTLLFAPISIGISLIGVGVYNVLSELIAGKFSRDNLDILLYFGFYAGLVSGPIAIRYLNVKRGIVNITRPNLGLSRMFYYLGFLIMSVSFIVIIVIIGFIVFVLYISVFSLSDIAKNVNGIPVGLGLLLFIVGYSFVEKIGTR